MKTAAQTISRAHLSYDMYAKSIKILKWYIVFMALVYFVAFSGTMLSSMKRKAVLSETRQMQSDLSVLEEKYLALEKSVDQNEIALAGYIQATPATIHFARLVGVEKDVAISYNVK